MFQKHLKYHNRSQGNIPMTCTHTLTSQTIMEKIVVESLFSPPHEIESQKQNVGVRFYSTV